MIVPISDLLIWNSLNLKNSNDMSNKTFIVAYIKDVIGRRYGNKKQITNFKAFVDNDAEKESKLFYQELLKEENLYSASLCGIIESTDYDTPPPKEIRVYGVDYNELPKGFNTSMLESDDDFITVAKEQGNEWSVSEFQEALNTDQISTINFSFKIIS